MHNCPICQKKLKFGTAFYAPRNDKSYYVCFENKDLHDSKFVYIKNKLDSIELIIDRYVVGLFFDKNPPLFKLGKLDRFGYYDELLNLPSHPFDIHTLTVDTLRSKIKNILLFR